MNRLRAGARCYTTCTTCAPQSLQPLIEKASKQAEVINKEVQAKIRISFDEFPTDEQQVCIGKRRKHNHAPWKRPTTSTFLPFHSFFFRSLLQSIFLCVCIFFFLSFFSTILSRSLSLHIHRLLLSQEALKQALVKEMEVNEEDVTEFSVTLHQARIQEGNRGGW